MTTNVSRRGALAGAAAVALAAGAGQAQTRGRVIAYVGTYTPAGRGIYAFAFDLATGALTPAGIAAEMANPSWLALDPTRGLLFAASEVDEHDGKPGGAVVSFGIDPKTGALVRRGEAGSGGAGPAHISLHPSGRWLFAANYGGGSVAVLAVAPDGGLSGPVHLERLAKEPATAEQGGQGGNLAISDHATPHAHMVQADPTGRFVVAADAGSDRLYIWRFDAETGRLSPASMPWMETAPGSAPRHFLFAGGGRRLYDLQEHDAVVVAYAFDPATGALVREGACATLPDGFQGSDLASELRASPDGRFLYAGNRLRNSIAVLKVGAAGVLRRLGETWIEADHPRSFSLDPSGRFLVSCNQRSDSLTCFRRDSATGLLRSTAIATAVGSPASVAFYTLAG